MVNRLTFKALFFFVVMSLVMGAITTFFLVTQAERLIRQQTSYSARTITQAAQSEFSRLPNTDESSLAAFCENQKDVRQVLDLRIVRPDGSVLANCRYAGSGPSRAGEPPVEPLDQLVTAMLAHRPDPEIKFQIGSLVGDEIAVNETRMPEWSDPYQALKAGAWVNQRGFTAGILEIEFSLREAVALRNSAQDRFWLVMILWGMVFTLAQTLLLSKWILFPVHYLMRIAGRVASGDEQARAKVVGTDEIADLGRSLNHMADALGAQKDKLEVQNKALLHREAIVQQELRLARVVQNELLEAGIFRLPGVECLGRVLQMNEVGGDFFDIEELPGHGVLMAIGDVSGKGVPAALVMVLVMSELRDVLRETTRPGEILEKLNNRLFERLGEEEIAYVTMLLARFEPSTKKLAIARAAHPPPLLLTPQRNGAGPEVFTIQAKGLPLGIEPSAVFVEKEMIVAPGDRLLMFTDGVLDLRTQKGLLTDEELMEMVRSHAGTPGVRMVDELFHELCTGGHSRTDDMTAVGLCVLEE